MYFRRLVWVFKRKSRRNSLKPVKCGKIFNMIEITKSYADGGLLQYLMANWKQLSFSCLFFALENVFRHLSLDAV